MVGVYNKIQELQDISSYSKHDKLVQGIINAIEDKILIQGNMLPSVNAMVKELGFASKTIVKAYNDLKDRGIIESKNRLGYYVINEDTDQKVKVALLLYSFFPFQQTFYNTFRTSLGENIQVDVFFHHSNYDVFETILKKIKNQYGMYVIAPIPDVRTKFILQDIPSHKLLIIDRFEKLDQDFSHVTQEFEISTYMALKKLIKPIQNFNNIVLFYKDGTDIPIEIKRAFTKFIEDYDINGSIQESYAKDSIKKGTIYFTIRDGDLWPILKDAKEREFDLGKDIGVFSGNDGPVKEIICGGITTLSTDFNEMAKQSAKFVLEKKRIHITIPTILTRRESL